MDNTELKRTLSLKYPHLGDSELAVAISRSTELTEAAVSEQIETWRKPFEQGRVSSMGGGTYASASTWAEIAAASDLAARNEQLKDSSILLEVSDLERKGTAAQRAAEQAGRELQGLWNEWNSLEPRADAIKQQLAGINRELESLTPEAVERKRHAKLSITHKV